MALSASTLKSGIEGLALTEDEATACAALAAAFKSYMAGAGSAGIPIAAAALDAPKAAMQSALAGMSTSGTGAAKIQAGIVAFWGAIIPATAWPTATLITPPTGLAGLAAALAPVFAANVAGTVNKANSALAIANAIHAIQIVGGIVAWPPIPTGVGPMPIL